AGRGDRLAGVRPAAALRRAHRGLVTGVAAGLARLHPPARLDHALVPVPVHRRDRARLRPGAAERARGGRRPGGDGGGVLAGRRLPAGRPRRAEPRPARPARLTAPPLRQSLSLRSRSSTRLSSQLTTPTMIAPQNAGQNPVMWNGTFSFPAIQ